MRRRAEPCRTLLVNIHMYARTRMRARGFGSLGNRFGRYGRFGRRPVHRMCWMGNASDAATSPHVCAVLRPVPTIGHAPGVAHRPTRANVAYPPTIPQPVGTWKKIEEKTGPWEQPPTQVEFHLLVRFFVTAMPARTN